MANSFALLVVCFNGIIHFPLHIFPLIPSLDVKLFDVLVGCLSDIDGDELFEAVCADFGPLLLVNLSEFS